jgi:AbrB family looped-hinge helix DNA binding protein
MRKEIVKVGQRGQIVIPKKIREKQEIKPGTLLKAIGINNYILLKKVRTKTLEEKFVELIQKFKLEKEEVQKIWQRIQKEREER